MNTESIKPVAVVVGFNLLTLLVFVTAPVTWVTVHLTDLCLLVVSSQIMIFLGYQFGLRSGLARATDPRLPFVRGRRLVSLLFTVYVLTFLVSYAYKMEVSPLDVTGMMNRLIAGILDPRRGYFGSLTKSGDGPVRWSVFFAISVFNQLFFVAGFLYLAPIRAGQESDLRAPGEPRAVLLGRHRDRLRRRGHGDDAGAGVALLGPARTPELPHVRD